MAMHKMFQSGMTAGIAALFLAVVLMPRTGLGRPEFAARQNQSCAKCHVNPMGGGMRNETGTNSSQKLSLDVTKEALAEKYPDATEFDPMLNDWLSLGADARLMWHNMQDDKKVESTNENSTFYLMQAELYAHAQLLPIFHFLYGYDAAQNTFEAYGIIDELPAGLYLKMGRFILPYGIRFDDHTIFTRSPIGFSTVSQDSGVEIGISPGPFFLTAAFTNGLLGENGQDRDKNHYAVTGQTGVRFWKIGLGGSYFHNDRDGFAREIYGPWATFGIGPVALLAEFDLTNQEIPLETDPTKTNVLKGSAAVAQLDVRIINGLFVQGRYTHMDPNLELDENFADQTSGGIVLYPFPYFHTIWQYRHNREPERAKLTNDEILIQGHFYF